MSAGLEVESTLTDRYQTTVPQTVRRALRLGKRDKIHYSIRPGGEVVLTRVDAAQVDDPFNFSDPWDEPVDTKYREIEQRLELFEQERANQQLDATIRHLSEKYGEDFDANEVVVAAMATGSTDLEATFRQITFDKIRDKATRAEAQLAKTQQNRAAKRDAGVVSGGSSAGSPTGVDVGAITTIADAWRAAKAQHGV